MTTRPLVIAGHPRSGTTLLRNLCDAHPELSITNEFPVFLQLGAPYRTYTYSLLRWWIRWNRNVLTTEGLLRLIDIPGSMANHGRKLLTGDRLVLRYLIALSRQLPKRVDVPNVAAALESLFPDARIVGDKFSEYVFHLDRLARSNDLMCLVIYRDGRDVASSALWKFRAVERENSYWRKHLSTVDRIARNWVRAIESMETHSDRIHLVRYEDLVRESGRELERLGRWLDVDPSGFPQEMIRDTSIGRYRTGLSEHELQRFHEIASRTLERMGYR